MSTKYIGKEQAEFTQAAAMRYAVETRFCSSTWENCWTDGSGAPETFATHREAQEAIQEHIVDCTSAVESGDMMDSPDPADLRVVAI